MARQVNYILRDLLRVARNARLGPSAQGVIDEATVYLAHFRRGDPVPNPDQPAEADLIGDESGEISEEQPVAEETVEVSEEEVVAGEFDTSDVANTEAINDQPVAAEADTIDEKPVSRRGRGGRSRSS